MGWLMQAGRFDRRANMPIKTRPARTAGSRSRRPAISSYWSPSAMPDMPTPRPMSCQGPASWSCSRGGRSRAKSGSAVGRRLTSRSISVPARSCAGDGTYFFTYGYTTVTDQQGRFAFDRVVPGRVTGRRTPPPRRACHAWGWQEPVEVKPGQTARVRIGGKGRPVIGRIVIDGDARGRPSTGRRASRW